MNRVFVPNMPTRFEPATGSYEPQHDISPAQVFGEFVFLFPGGRLPRDYNSVAMSFRDALADFNDSDHLLLIGHPILLGMATHFAATANQGRVKFLRFQTRNQRYELVRVNMWEGAEERPATLEAAG